MDSYTDSIELTDQELEQIVAGSGIGLGFVMTNATAGGPSGPSASGQFLGFGNGSTFGLGFANGQSHAFHISGPLGFTASDGLSTGQALGFGY
jgi:hypothetical protein